MNYANVMTTSRAIRGTKANVFFYLCAILIITGLIACYNSTQTELQEVKKSNDMCHQQQENLSTQLQVISDYKQKLEKSLKNEKAEHQQSKNSLKIKMSEEKSRSQKLTSDALLKFNSLQQHYKLLQTQHDDFKEESSNAHKKQLEEINSLQSKLKELEEELKKVKSSKESIKTQFTELELENIQLKKSLKKTANNESQQQIKFYTEEYHVLADKYNALKIKCGEPPEELAADLAGAGNKPSEKSVANLPLFKFAENPSSSTKAVPKVSLSQAHMNGARPLVHAPSVTPATAKKEANLKPPQGVVEPPENRENQNEQPQLEFEKKAEKVDALEKDNVAQEEFDAPQNNIDGLAFAEDAGLKQAGLNIEQKRDVIADSKKHNNIDPDYKDLQREEEGDDDLDDYGGARNEEVAVRN